MDDAFKLSYRLDVTHVNVLIVGKRKREREEVSGQGCARDWETMSGKQVTSGWIEQGVLDIVRRACSCVPLPPPLFPYPKCCPPSVI